LLAPLFVNRIDDAASGRMMNTLRRPEASKLPVLILSGSLGAGKTTFLNQLRLRSEALRLFQVQGTLLMIINDFAEENVDAALVCRQSVDADALTRSDEELPTPPPPSVVPISGGCVCCNKLPTLIRTLVSAATMAYANSNGEERRWEYVILECTGLADTAPVVAAILTDPALKDLVEVDAVVTVVDVSSYSIENDPLKGSQLVGANVVLLSKTDLMPSETPPPSDSAWREATQNPDVGIVPSSHGYPSLRDWSADEHLVMQFLFRRQPESLRLFLSVAASLSDRTDAEREHEEALERERLGLSTICYRVWEAPWNSVAPSRSHDAVKVARRVVEGTTVDVVLDVHRGSSSLRLSWVLRHIAGILKGGRQGRKHPAVVWRSKGFLTALDDVGDEDTCGGSDAVVDDCKRQFSWNSQGKQFDYAPITPPHVALPLNNSGAVRPPVSSAACVVELVLIGTMDVEVTVAQLDAALLP
jgi:G3E family GTPase